MDHADIKQCRVCENSNLEKILFLGNQPPANALQDSQETSKDIYPLTLAHCSQCNLVQIIETVPKEKLFNNYYWVTGTSSTARAFSQTFYENILKNVNLKKDDLVVEVASNDGTFLRPFIENGYKTLGVDPAQNIATKANEEGIQTLCKFWDKKTSNEVAEKFGQAKVVFARNVVPHVSELHDVVDGLANVLIQDGIGAIEFHYVGNILKELQYDSIYHEHLCYFSIKSVQELLKRHNLNLFHVDLSPISGGAYIVYFSKTKRDLTPLCIDLMKKEENERVNDVESWREFAQRCKKHRDLSRELMNKADGKKVIGYGASARSSTYLNFCGFSSSEIDAIIDNNPLKKHKYTPGSAIQIVPSEEGLADKPEILFILAWNFKDEIIKICKEKGFTGTYLFPFPETPYYEK